MHPRMFKARCLSAYKLMLNYSCIRVISVLGKANAVSPAVSSLGTLRSHSPYQKGR